MSGQTRLWEGGRFEGETVLLGLAAVIFCHSHRPCPERNNGVLCLNPGSAGPRRFTLPVNLARIKLQGVSLNPELVELKV